MSAYKEAKSFRHVAMEARFVSQLTVVLLKWQEKKRKTKQILHDV